MRLIPYLFVMMVAARIGAQESKQKDPVDFAAPGPMHKILEKMVGQWTVEVNYKIGSFEGKSTAECKASMQMDGRFLRRSYASQMNGQPFLVEQTIGFDTLRKEYFEWQIESNNTGRLETKGKWDEKSKAIVCNGSSFDPTTMNPATLTTKTILDSEDQFTIEWWMKVGDAPATKSVTLVHKRKK